MNRLLSIPFAAVLALVPCALAFADTVSIATGDGNPITYDGVRVERVQDGQIIFSVNGRDSTPRDFSKVVSMKIDSEPAFNQAEVDYKAQNWSKAVDEYQQVVKTTDKDWLKSFASSRLAEAANKAGRLDVSVDQYIAQAIADPAAAAKRRPALPDSASSYLDAAAQKLAEAAGKENVKPEVKQELLTYLVQVDRKRHDAAGEATAAQQLQAMGVAAGDPETLKVLADAKLKAAAAAIDAKKYDEALQTINGSKSLFADPSQQAQAMYEIAQAKAGQAAAGNDADAWKDAALAYMRVVANFKDQSNNPVIPDALLKTAEIEEQQLKDSKAALGLYRKVAAQYKDTPAGAEAQKNVERLGSAG